MMQIQQSGATLFDYSLDILTSAVSLKLSEFPTAVEIDTRFIYFQYRNLIVTVLSLLHPDGDPSVFEEAADGIISLERQLSEVSMSVTIEGSQHTSYYSYQPFWTSFLLEYQAKTNDTHPSNNQNHQLI